MQQPIPHLSVCTQMPAIRYTASTSASASSAHEKSKSKSNPLVAGKEFYSEKDFSVLGEPDFLAAIGNPLKGLMGGVRWALPPLPSSVPSSLEWYNLGLDEIMVGDNSFDWTILEGLLSGSASRKMHAVFSVFMHWPGQPLRLPPQLRDVPLYDTGENGKSPNYGDCRILKALKQYILALGVLYDGDKRIAAIHVGLLGFWGEGHTYPDTHLVPEEAGKQVASWYQQAFSCTQIQARYAGDNSKDKGLYDGSLFYSSLDGPSNGGVTHEWFMWPQILAARQENAWKTSIMGGETRPELQASLFTSSYPAKTYMHQEFTETVDTMHISYILHHDAFTNGGYKGDMLQRARDAHAYIGYAFCVSHVAAFAGTCDGVMNIQVTVTQAGNAPFYYDLALVMLCSVLPNALKADGVNEIVEKGQSKTFAFANIPLPSGATDRCITLRLHLESSHVYDERPVVFAQGTSGTVALSVPIPNIML